MKVQQYPVEPVESTAPAGIAGAAFAGGLLYALVTLPDQDIDLCIQSRGRRC